ncbi:MAG: hypothetical protein KF699_02970 [Phycisphaeraceae bacterium]|nr:hypothetical protein [Phycisphaeraceae bacterium]
MTISFDMPGSIEDLLRKQGLDPAQIAKESALIELYRQRRITHHELSIALALSHAETDALLKHHGVTEDLPSPTEIAAEVEHILRMRAA